MVLVRRQILPVDELKRTENQSACGRKSTFTASALIFCHEEALDHCFFYGIDFNIRSDLHNVFIKSFSTFVKVKQLTILNAC